MDELLKVTDRRGLFVSRADRPFVFLIRDNRAGSLLFLGRFVDPRDCATAR